MLSYILRNIEIKRIESLFGIDMLYQGSGFEMILTFEAQDYQKHQEGGSSKNII